ncbi:MAG: hypothetical protein LBM09_02655 [Candidatus Nomurabacteria bacterium]|jgi:isopentenyldiphosphate isomerase|nr:hypothetical protein [Candidatus Nomurabacteria bacterium]
MGGGSNQKLAVHVVSVLLFDTDGGIILQKRSPNKRHNAGLIDKTLGGHIKWGDGESYTITVETIQELLTPSVVLDNEDDFMKTLEVLSPYLDTVAVIFKKVIRPWQLKKIVDGKSFAVDNIVCLGFGVYGGRMRPADKEAAGILYYSSLDQLESEMKTSPDIFTDDLKQLIEQYRGDILSLQKKIREILKK